MRPAAGGNSSVVEILEGAEEEATRALYGFPASGFRELEILAPIAETILRHDAAKTQRFAENARRKYFAPGILCDTLRLSASAVKWLSCVSAHS